MGASPEGRNVGQVLSRGEARHLSRETGKSIADISNRASERGVGIGAALGNQLGRAVTSPYGQDARRMGISYSDDPKSRAALEGLRGLQMQKGQAYYGSTTTTTPGRQTGYKDSRSYTPGTTTTTPIVLPRGFGRPQLPALGGASSGMRQTEVEYDPTPPNLRRAVPDGASSGMRQAVTPPPPNIRRKDMGSYTNESLERRYTDAAANATRRAEIFDARSKRDTNQKTGAVKPRDLMMRQQARAEDLRQKAAAYTRGAEQMRARMTPAA